MYTVHPACASMTLRARGPGPVLTKIEEFVYNDTLQDSNCKIITDLSLLLIREHLKVSQKVCTVVIASLFSAGSFALALGHRCFVSFLGGKY